MGIGKSRLNAGDGEVVPSKIRPLLIGRFEEFKKCRNGEGTLSKKKLLKDADEEDGNSRTSRETEIEDKVSSPKEIQPPKEETVVRATTMEKLSRVVPMPTIECEIEENNANKGNIEQVNKDVEPNNQDKVIHTLVMDEAKVQTEEGKNAELVEEPKQENEQVISAKGDDNDNNDDSDNEDESEEFDRFLCPGSPSFRIYCIEAEKRKEEECANPTIVHQKSHSADSVVSTASGNLNEVLKDVEIESTTKRKGNKKKSGAMKTLLKVKSCYHPMCTCTGNDRGNIVTAKAAK